MYKLEKEELSNYIKKTNNSYSFIIGQNKDGEIVTSNLNETPHLFITGSTGAGANQFLFTTLTTLLLNNTKEKLKVLLIDPYKIEFDLFEHCPQIINSKVARECDEIITSLKDIEHEMKKRFILCSNKHVENIDEYNKKSKVQLPKIVVAFNEYFQLMNLDSYKTVFYNSLIELVKHGKTAGIHLLIKTQRFSTNIFTEELKNSLPTIITFRLHHENESTFLLNEPGAEKLDSATELLYKNNFINSPTQKLKSMMIVLTDHHKKILSTLK